MAAAAPDLHAPAGVAGVAGVDGVDGVGGVEDEADGDGDVTSADYDDEGEYLPNEVVAELTTTGQTVAVAESITGGLVCAALTDVPGASAVVRGGVVAYATDLKAELLGVSAALLASAGPVHPVVATSMARAVRARLGSTYGLATTGVAGPDPQGPQPVGTVYVAVDGPDGSSVERHQLSGDRAEIRAATVSAALGLLLTEATTGDER